MGADVIDIAEFVEIVLKVAVEFGAADFVYGVRLTWRGFIFRRLPAGVQDFYRYRIIAFVRIIRVRRVGVIRIRFVRFVRIRCVRINRGLLVRVFRIFRRACGFGCAGPDGKNAEDEI